jgi:hypothetical protein
MRSLSGRGRSFFLTSLFIELIEKKGIPALSAGQMSEIAWLKKEPKQ